MGVAEVRYVCIYKVDAGEQFKQRVIERLLKENQRTLRSLISAREHIQQKLINEGVHLQNINKRGGVQRIFNVVLAHNGPSNMTSI